MYLLGIVSKYVLRPNGGSDLASALSSPHISMPCPQMCSNLMGDRGEPTNQVHEKAVCRKNM